MGDAIRILIVDDHAIVRKGLYTLLMSEAGMNVVGEAVDGVEAVEKALALQPDVILLDMVMPRMSGIEATAEIKRHQPQARILVLTSFSDDDKVFPAIKAGALGYVLKDASPEQLLKAIYEVYAGEPSLHPTIALKLIRELKQPSDLPPASDPLTEREVEVIKLVARGLTNGEIAKQLVISERTVSNHIGNILDKLHLANRTQAALYALREGLVDLD